MSIVEAIVQKILDSKKIAILYHINGDGDAIGASLGLYHAFSNPNNTISIYAEEEIPKSYKFLPSAHIINCSDMYEFDYDLVISIDCGDLKRLGKRVDIYNSAKSTIYIDHHKNSESIGDIVYVNEEASASAELIYDIIMAAKMPLSKEVAECLYTGISTDTGNFRFSNTSPKTHRIAADLIECGLDISRIYTNLYENAPVEKLLVLAKVLQSLELYNDGKVTLMHATLDDINSVDGAAEHFDNTANYGLSIENVELAILMREQSDGITKVSFRAKNDFDCSTFARQFGGGGHAKAAGCTIEMSFDNAKKMLLDKLARII